MEKRQFWLLTKKEDLLISTVYLVQSNFRVQPSLSRHTARAPPDPFVAVPTLCHSNVLVHLKTSALSHVGSNFGTSLFSVCPIWKQDLCVQFVCRFVCVCFFSFLWSSALGPESLTLGSRTGSVWFRSSQRSGLRLDLLDLLGLLSVPILPAVLCQPRSARGSKPSPHNVWKVNLLQTVLKQQNLKFLFNV